MDVLGISFKSLWSALFDGSYLGGVDKLISQTLSNCFDVTECSFASASAQQPDGLVDTSQRRNVDGLTTDGTGATDTR